MFIQVGYGLEGALPDITAYDIRDYHISPHFRKGDYEGGLAEGIDSIFKAIRGEYKGNWQNSSGTAHQCPRAKLFVLHHLCRGLDDHFKTDAAARRL